MDPILTLIFQLKDISPQLGDAALMLWFYAVNIIAFLLGQPTFCSTPAVCL